VTAALLALAAASADARVRIGQFVGKVDGTAIGVSLGAAGSLAYVCDGKRVGTWFKGGALRDRELTLNADAGRLQLSLGGKNLKARVGGETATLKPAKRDAGLYRSDNKVGSKAKLAGWVVLNSGKQVGTLLNGARLTPAPALSTTTLVAGSLVASPVTDPSDPQPVWIDIADDGLLFNGAAETMLLGGGTRLVRWTWGGDDAFVAVDAGVLASLGFVVSQPGLLLARAGLAVTRNGITTRTTDGLGMLRVLDANLDGTLNSVDPAFAAVRILKDGNNDGDFADGGDSLQTASEAAVTELSLQSAMDRSSRAVSQVSTATSAAHQVVMAVIRTLKV
jgi:hypothetical protein